ncbi:hypothetical protein J3R83DRAFT_11072 [Lanmaoa asiatica]|nr:hypothetical protein J3R83DRAFT_11072 [Lanmaoa asiatica]
MHQAKRLKVSTHCAFCNVSLKITFPQLIVPLSTAQIERMMHGKLSRAHLINQVKHDGYAKHIAHAEELPSTNHAANPTPPPFH